jgi:hypothetical protein
VKLEIKKYAKALIYQLLNDSRASGSEQFLAYLDSAQARVKLFGQCQRGS